MRRWHEERHLMLRRWRQEIAIHGGHDGWKCGWNGNCGEFLAPIPPVVACADDHCHCFAGPGFFRKRAPLDCGNTRCGICHSGKWDRKARGAKKRAAIEWGLL